MSHLKIDYFSGEGFEHPLTQSEAVSIGSNDSNDITVDGPDVALMHCRIIWKKETYEVSAANLDGVSLNGSLVRQAALKSGDQLQIGDAEITLHIKEKVTSSDKPEEVEIGLKPDSDDEVPIPEETKSKKSSQKSSAKKKRSRDDKKKSSSKSKSSRPSKKDDSAYPNDFFEEDDDLNDEGMYSLSEEIPTHQPTKSKKKKSKKEDENASRSQLKRGKKTSDGEPDLEGLEPDSQELATDEKTSPQKSGISMLKKKLTQKPMRPGERDAVRSPVLMFLGGGALFLVVAAATIWAVIGRTSAQNYYNAAIQDKNDKKFAQAITMLEKFPEKFPKSSLEKDAFYALCQSRVEQPLTSSSQTKWADALKKLDQYITLNRDDPTFKDRRGEIYQYARKIANGSATSALKGGGQKPPARRELLVISKKAKGLVSRYGDKEKDTTMGEFLAGVERTILNAGSAITKQEVFLKAEANINKALANKDPMQAFAIRIRLLTRYPDFVKDRQLNALVIKTLETEKALIKVENQLDQQAITKEITTPVVKPLSLTLHTRSRGGESVGEQVVFAVAKDCCYGIDTITGTPQWRRVIGLDTPFFPIAVQSAVGDGVLLFDTNRKELMLLESANGKLVWRQPLQGAISGEPVIHDGLIYVPTLSNQLWKISLETGKAISRLTFSQPIVSRPLMISDGKQMIIAGDKAVFYLLSTRPLQCESVSYMGHDSGAVVAPLIAMGSLILMPENNGLDSCLLRILNISPKTKRLIEVGTKSIAGLVQDQAVLRGNKLFVPASQERVIAFTASDDKGQPPLTEIAKIQLPNPHDIATHLSVGPDKQLWLGSSALYKLQLKPNEVQLTGQQLAVGTMTQPMQLIGQYLYLGRQSYYSTATLFSRAEREKMTSSWRIILGCRILAMTTKKSTSGTSLVCLTEAGDGFRISAKDLEKGGFKTSAGEQFRYAKELNVPIGALPVTGNKLFAYIGGERPRGWWINSIGQAERLTTLTKAVTGKPIALGKGVVLPQQGRLQLVLKSRGRRVTPFTAKIEKGVKFQWKFLAPIDDKQFLACDHQNKLYRIQYRTSPRRLLAKATELELEQPIDFPPVHHNKQIAIADSTGMLKLLDVQSFDTVSQQKLASPPTNDLWVVGNTLIVETSHNQLTAFQMGKKLKQLWNITFSKSTNGLAGTPLQVGGKILIATRSGEAITLDSLKGTVLNRLNTGEPLTSGPLQVGKYLIVPTLDGSLIRIESVLQSGKKQNPSQKETTE